MEVKVKVDVYLEAPRPRVATRDGPLIGVQGLEVQMSVSNYIPRMVP